MHHIMKIGVIREGKVPPDQRVPLTPDQCLEAINQFESIDLNVQNSPIRKFKDEAYSSKGINMAEDMTDREVLIGVKEVPIDMLIPNKTYFFFSHTIKEQPYNRNLLRAILDKNIKLVDWECLTEASGRRLIGFGRYAGIVGAYNGVLAFGKRFDLFDLKPANECEDRDEMEQELAKVKLPNIKIALTGRGRVANGAMEILDYLKIRKVSVDEYLTASFDEPVYVQLGVEHYNKRKDGAERTAKDFYVNFTEYDSDFMRFAEVTDFFIAGHFFAEGSPFLFTREDAKKENFNIKVVADVSCDIDGPVASTIRPSTIADPIYGYNPISEKEDDINNEGVITVMAVDNLPCELPKNASEDFGSEFLKHILPALLNGDKDEIIKRATITENGKLTDAYMYLDNYVKGE